MSSDSSSSSSVLPLLVSLPLTSPSLTALLALHQPFVRPSLLSPSVATKFVSRINGSLASRDVAVEEKHAALRIGQDLVQQDTEGWVLAGWGKGWVGSALAALSSQALPLASVGPYLDLLVALVLASPTSPSFEREVIHPMMGKLSTTMLKLVERTTQQSAMNAEVLCQILRSGRAVLVHSPATFRPVVTGLRTLLVPLIVYSQHHGEPSDLRGGAVDLLASLYLTQGKAQISQSWRAEMGDAMLGLGICYDAIVADGWQSDVKAPVTLPPGLAPFPVDAPSRLPLALCALEGYTEIALALLNQSTSRPVPVPIAQIVRLAIRLLDLTLHSPTVPYISPQYHANLIASLARIWTSGLLLLGTIAASCRDHLLPHLSEILDTTLHLVDTTPDSFCDTQSQLLRFHNLMLTLYPASTWSPDHPSRLLKQCLSQLSPLLDGGVDGPHSSGTNLANGTSKKGKKRARGEEDGVVASLEGREGRRIGVEGDVALEALQLIPHLHSTPLLSPALLTLSIRLHLSVYLALPAMALRRFSDQTIQDRLIEAVRAVLESACLISEEGGHSKGWKSVIISVLGPTYGRLSPLLHPQLPPLTRPAPPLSALHFFTTETEDEAKIRQEPGFATGVPGQSADAASDGEMELDEPAETVIVPVAPNDVRAGRRDVLDTTLPPPVPGHVQMLDTDQPQRGHYPAGLAASPAVAASKIPVQPTNITPTLNLPASGNAIGEGSTSGAVPTAVDSIVPTGSAKIPSADAAAFKQDFIGFSGAKGAAASSMNVDLEAAGGICSAAGMGVAPGPDKEEGEGSDGGIPDLDSDFSGFEDDDDEEDGGDEDDA